MVPVPVAPDPIQLAGGTKAAPVPLPRRLPCCTVNCAACTVQGALLSARPPVRYDGDSAPSAHGAGSTYASRIPAEPHLWRTTEEIHNGWSVPAGEFSGGTVSVELDNSVAPGRLGDGRTPRARKGSRIGQRDERTVILRGRSALMKIAPGPVRRGPP